MKLLAQDPIPTIFGGTINPPISSLPANPSAALGKLMGLGIELFTIIASLFVLIYMFWGAYDWISSSGEKEKISKAQNKITNAVLGLLIIIVVLTLFGVVTGDVLGIFKKTPNGWEFNLPHL